MRPDKKKVRHHDSRKKAAQAKQKSEQKDPQPKPKRVIESNWDVDKPDFPESSDEEGTVDDTSAFSTGLDFNYVVENRSDQTLLKKSLVFCKAVSIKSKGSTLSQMTISNSSARLRAMGTFQSRFPDPGMRRT